MYEHKFIPLTHAKFLGVSQPSPSFIYKHNWSQASQVSNCRLFHTYPFEMAAKVALEKEITYSV